MYTATTYAGIVTPTVPTNILGKIAQMVALKKQRIALAKMDDTQLEDLGLTYFEAQAEAARPFWDMPANWA